MNDQLSSTNEETVQLELPLLLPDIDDACDSCIEGLERTLENRRGILWVHIRDESDPPELCLHFDPNLVSLAAVQRIAQEAGSAFTSRFRHEAIPFTGLDTADSADVLASALESLPGMLHASVNYAAGLAFVAYDANVLDLARIRQTIGQMGASPLPWVVETGQSSPEGAGREPGRAGALALLPSGFQWRRQLGQVALAGLLLLAGWAGATFFGLPDELAFVLYLFSFALGALDVALHAIPGLLRGKFDTDVLMLAAALGAAALGRWAEGAFLLFLFGLGHAGEQYALDRARQAVNALGELMPKTARVKRGGGIVEVPVESLQIGDVVLVRPGDRLPTDGRIARGRSSLDQSAITGESLPVEKGPGDEVFAGTINQDAALDVRVTRLTADNTLSRVMKMVAEAQEQQSPSQQFAQRFTARFVPAVLVLVALVILLPPLFGWMSLEDSFYRGMLLLIAASPCALAIGTPAAILAGIAQAARNGVLIKGGVHLENLGGVKVMAFDKTGTLTHGRFQVTDVVALNGTGPEALLRLAGAVEQQASHPLAAAVVRETQERGLDLPPAEGLESLPGLGVSSRVGGQRVLIGSLDLFRQSAAGSLDEEVVQAVERLEEQGKTTMAVNADGTFLGVLGLADEPRPGVRGTLGQLLALGVDELLMLTGDNEVAARQIAAQVGVTGVRAGLMPEDKLAAIRQRRAEAGSIAMVGDGVNDAPALAAATVGIAMGGAGTAVALETADVALMADDLSRLPFAVGLSRATRRIVRQNLAIALGVIGLLLFSSVLGLVALGGAVILHEGSTVLVVLNALRLLRYQAP